MTNRIILTKDGYNKLKKELEELEKVKIPEILHRLKKAREDGDLRENNQWIKAKEDLEFAHARQEEIKYILQFAEVNNTTGNADTVNLGDTIKIEMDGNPMKITIVDQHEADPFSGKISINSPLGGALINAKIGSIVDYKTPNGDIKKIKIIEKA